MAEATQRLPRHANLPTPPQRPDQVVPYLWSLDQAVADVYSTLSELVQANIVVRGSTSFGAAATTASVTFDSPLDDADFVPLLVPQWNDGAHWVTSLASTGFTINVATAPGGGGSTMLLVVAR